MPYSISKQGSKWCVVKKSTGESKGCSSSEDMAKRHMAALYANEKALGVAWLDRTEPKCFEVVKTVDGRTRVFLRVSNNFKDRHGEIITEAAHKEYEQYVAESGDYPEFWLWHRPFTRWGQADLVSYDDGFLTVSGLADWGKEYIAEGLARATEELGVSHGFKYISLEGQGQIDWYRMREASPLPRLEAANLWTSLLVAKELEGEGMALGDKHKKFFASVGVPDSVINQWDQENKDIGGLLKSAGLEYKEVEEPNPPVPPKPDDDETVEVTLPDGGKAMVPASAVAKQKSALDDAPVWAKALLNKINGLEAKQKELETKMASNSTDTWEAAIAQGRGFSGSKEGEAPNGSETRELEEWEKQLAAMLTEGAN